MSTNNANDIEEIELSIEDAKKQVRRKEALIRLEENADFKMLITDGFMEKHAVRQVMMKGHPDLQSEKAQNMLNKQIDAIGQFKQFLLGIWTLGSNAEVALERDEATLIEMLAEDAAEQEEGGS